MADFETIFELLDVQLNAFAVCEVGNGCALKVDPIDKIIVHYVLQGEGSIEWEHGILPIRAGMMVVIPKGLEKRINGVGPVAHVSDASGSCPLTSEIVRFRACQGSVDLVLGCASVTATVGGTAVFDHLEQPLGVSATDEALPLLFKAILAELARPAIGTKAIIEALMKQIVVLLLRSHFERGGAHAALYLKLTTPELGRALVAMTATPQNPHSLDSLAGLAGMSRSRFAYHFAKAYGRSPMDYLQSVRLKAAARLLRSSDMLVKSIAAAVGFASRSHFSRAFRAEFGIDPTAFRDRSACPAKFYAEVAADPVTPSSSVILAARERGSRLGRGSSADEINSAATLNANDRYEAAALKKTASL
jgi:AraC-like DNA-binding protein